MTGVIIKAMGTSLVLTIVFELAFALICGIRRRKNLLLCVLVNVLTNPIVTCTYYYFKYYLHALPPFMTALTAVLEISAVLAEWLVYKYVSDIKNPFAFSLGINCFSYFTGLAINMII